ncbi:hypothetical protein F7725_003153 [Dissostichus mawsoni]|uniref:Ubiquitin-like domain-containing protein n=1 Tax=Dissostichus mawsoni TaxID=36200 RepID=A0A7J5Y9H4_DISMA|nr:hypothetical protein F7725_003153 [Dissostichus mawsoni]
MAVCALTMLDGMETEVTVAGGVLLLVLALVFAWLSTHVADRGDHILGTILTVGAHASLIGLGGHEGYSGGSPSTDTPEQQTPPASQENKPDDGESGTERGEGEGTGEGAEGFLNDTEELAVVEPQDTVGVLKSKYFSGREHQIKLIYQGQLLQDPKKTLFSLNISQNSVIHCHISQAMLEDPPEEGAQPGAGAGAGSGVSGDSGLLE